jgi:hypothetical protein
MTIRKNEVQAPSHIKLDILTGRIDRYRQTNQFTVLVLWHPTSEKKEE